MTAMAPCPTAAATRFLVWERASPATETSERLSQGGTGCAGAATSGQPLMPTDRGRPPEIRAHLGYGSVDQSVPGLGADEDEDEEPLAEANATQPPAGYAGELEAEAGLRAPSD